jgi:hypothetical protein
MWQLCENRHSEGRTFDVSVSVWKHVHARTVKARDSSEVKHTLVQSVYYVK